MSGNMNPGALWQAAEAGNQDRGTRLGPDGNGLPLHSQQVFRREAEALCRSGPRALREFLAEISKALPPDLRAMMAERSAVYASLSPEALALSGGDRFAPTAMLALKGGRE
jgi:hypothetical protein